MKRLSSIASFLLLSTFVILTPSARAERTRELSLSFENADLPADMTVTVEATAQYHIAKLPTNKDSNIQELTPTVQKSSPKKLSSSAHGQSSNGQKSTSSASENTLFSFDVPDTQPDERAVFAVTVNYTISTEPLKGPKKKVSRTTTFEVPTTNDFGPISRCLRVQAFPGNNVRVGLTPCGVPWTTP
jgi:cytoskeletal protein RodZ